ncbi:MAG: pyruvate dehydrogenase (acetyl-transferring) E1 component subunit alpha [Polyangiaceae bacterium]
MPNEGTTSTSPEATRAVNYEELTRYFRDMQRIRRAEEEAARAYAQGKIGGFLHLYIGQEALGVGACAAIEPNDYVITTYRDHGFALARGMTMRAMIAELYGKEPGCSKGLGGSMHLFDAEHRMMGGYGIVGGHIPLGAGFAFASKYKGENDVTLCFMGDGAVPIGDFHEGLSLAALWKLPVVFIIENNQYSMGTPLERTHAVRDLTLKGAGYGMPTDRFHVEDVLDVKERIGVAVKRAREEHTPTLIEAVTYRFRGHSMSDPGKYRTAEEVEAQKQRDPLFKARTDLIAAGREAEVLKIEAEVEAEVADALAFSESAPEPGPEILEATTYVGPFAR